MGRNSILLGFALVIILIPTPLNADSMYVSDAYGYLWDLDVHTRAATLIGYMGVAMTDIAFSPSGALYGISFDRLYAINPRTARTTAIGSLGVMGANALTFTSAGVLYAADCVSFTLLQVDPMTGVATAVASTLWSSDGDLVLAPDGSLLLTASGRLVSLNPATGSATLVGYTGSNAIFGLAYVGDTLYGITYAGGLLTMDPRTGATTSMGRTSPLLRAYGASTVPSAVPEPNSLLLVGVVLLTGSRVFRRNLI